MVAGGEKDQQQRDGDAERSGACRAEFKSLSVSVNNEFDLLQQY